MIPIMQLMLFGFIDETVHDVKTVVVDQDRSVESRNFMDQMRASKTFKITRLTSSPEDARADIRSGSARVGVVIPAKFHDKMLRGNAPQVLVLIDGSDSTVSAQALASINGLVAQENLAKAGTATVGGIAAQPIILFNPEGRTANYLIPGLVAVLMMIAGMLLSASAIVSERERGTFEQLLVTPVHPVGLVLGKVAPTSASPSSRARWCSPSCASASTCPSAAASCSSSAPPASTSSRSSPWGSSSPPARRPRWRGSADGAGDVPPVHLPLRLHLPARGLSEVLQAIGHIFPVTYMIAIMRGVILRDANVVDMWPNLAVLAAMSVLLVLLASRSIHKVAQ